MSKTAQRAWHSLNCDKFPEQLISKFRSKWLLYFPHVQKIKLEPITAWDFPSNMMTEKFEVRNKFGNSSLDILLFIEFSSQLSVHQKSLKQFSQIIFLLVFISFTSFPTFHLHLSWLLHVSWLTWWISYVIHTKINCPHGHISTYTNCSVFMLFGFCWKLASN